MEIYFRRAEISDHPSTRDVVIDAFGVEGAETAKFLDDLRADDCILGEWLAEEFGVPIAHVAFSRVWLEDADGTRTPAAILTPLAVSQNRQRIGIGLKLMDHALKELESGGETVFFVLGHPDYYPRAGFLASRAAEVDSPWQGASAFMARATSNLKGRLILPLSIANAH